MQEWQSGDRVVYPGLGVVEIIAKELNEQFGPGTQVYVLELMQSSRRVMISVEKAKCILRPVVSQFEAVSVLDSLKCPLATAKAMTWQKRKKLLQTKLNSRCLQDVADVLRELCYRKSVKDLSFSQRVLYDTGAKLIAEEVSISLERSMDDIDNQIHAQFMSESCIAL